MTPLPSKKNVWPQLKLFEAGRELYVQYMVELVCRGRACELIRGDVERRAASEVPVNRG